MRSPRALLALLAVAALALAACGGDDGGDADASTDGAELTALEREYADAVAAQFAENEGDEDELQLTKAEAECMAVAMMSVLGAEVFVDNGVTPEDLAESDGPGEALGSGVIAQDDAEAVVDRWLACADITGQMAELLNDDLDLDREGVECMKEQIEETNFVRDMFVLTLTSGDDEPPAFMSRVTTLMETCAGDSIAESFAESIKGSGLSDAQAECVADHVLGKLGFEGLAAAAEGGTGGSAVAQVTMEAFVACDVPMSDLSG